MNRTTRPQQPATAANSGIVQAGSDRYIPATKRPDGTVRKERKVRPGYTPPEDVAKYSNTRLDSFREASKPLPKGYIPGMPLPSDSNTPSPFAQQQAKSKSQKKNEKRKKKRNADGTVGSAEAEEDNKVEAITKDMSQLEVTSKSKPHTTTTAQSQPQSQASSEDPAKKLKNLRKKLRQVEQLEEKKSSGESLLPEQEEKISKKSELIAEIEALEKDLS
ncbi:hypothetical protein BKA69DRAFT_1037054 [Paraphysoderma sedebokerense]|nr:hypothetical protein BKA69DRAFT_1037054 [Paraphysoderma sedebokerense]